MVDSVPADRLDARTPCDEWTVADVVEHVVTTQHEFLERMGVAGDSSVDDRRSVTAAMQAALDDPARCNQTYDGYFGPTTVGETVDQFYSMDLMVHAWDIAEATGGDTAMDPAEVPGMLAMAREMGDRMRVPGGMGPEVAVADDADDQTRLLGLLGRRA